MGLAAVGTKIRTTLEEHAGRSNKPLQQSDPPCHTPCSRMGCARPARS